MSVDTSMEELRHMLVPAGGGVHVVSTGLRETRALQRAIYHAQDDEQVEARWHESLDSLPSARIAILGVPSDTGAGFVRGANRAPAVLRQTLLEKFPDHPFFGSDVVDVGDVRVIPHFLADDMLSPTQIEAARRALYGDPAIELPVSPLDIAARALEHIRALAPDVVPVVIGGDHSIGWPAFATALLHAEKQRSMRVGLLHFDAHTDLLEERLGVRYCFATWAYHANELLGRDGRLVQVGIRASGRDRAHWESTLGVRQYWPEEIEERTVDSIADEILERYDRLGVNALYVSNDIDGTDISYAGATGTPEDGGLDPDFVSALTRRVAENLPVVGADLVEVAPTVCNGQPEEPATTLETASRYLADLIDIVRPRPVASPQRYISRAP